MTDSTYNGWKNYATWNVALWIENDQFLYNTARACVEYKDINEQPYDKFIRCMMYGQIGRHLQKTPDGVVYNDETIDQDALNEMMYELAE